MRLVFWLSRASAPCGGIRTALQMTHSCVTLHFALYSLLNLTNTGSAQSILAGFGVVNTIERNDFGAFWLSWNGLYGA